MDAPGSFDRALLVLARTRGHTPARERAVRAYSRLGEHAACWFALGRRRSAAGPRPTARPLAARGSGWSARPTALNYAVKFAVRRRRPRARRTCRR